MKEKIIFVGSMKEEPIHLVGETANYRQYHKVDERIIEYKNIGQYEELEATEDEFSSVLLFMDQLEYVERELLKDRCREVVYVPDMQDWELDILFRMIQQSRADIGRRHCIGVAGKGDSLGRMMMDLLKNFKIMQNLSGYHLLLALPKKAGINEICHMEDVLREYTMDGSSLYIEQMIVEDTKECHYFLLKM